MGKKCFVCEGNLIFFGKRLGYQYDQCANCRSIQLNPMPGFEEIFSAYNKEYIGTGHHERDPLLCNREKHNHYLSIIKALIKNKAEGLVLDYGAGWGGLSELLIKNNFETIGIELSKEMVAYCQKNKLPVRHGDIKSLANMKEAFDAVVLCTVFEHLTNIEEFLQEMRKLIKNNGFFMSLHPTSIFPDLMIRLFRLWNQNNDLPALHKAFSPPWHTNLISLKGMEILMHRHGFELVSIAPALQSRANNVTRYLQIVLERINKMGWFLMGQRWPLVIAHVFVFRKIGV